MSDRVDQLTARLLRAEAEADRALLRSRELARDAARAAEGAGVERPISDIATAESVVAVTQSLCDVVVELSGKLRESSSKCKQLERENESIKLERKEAQSYAEELISVRRELRSSQSSVSLLQAERDDLRTQMRQLESGAEQVRSQWVVASIKEAGLADTVAQLESDLAQTRARLAAAEKEAHDNAVMVLQLRRELGNKTVPGGVCTSAFILCV
jgi:chromosome segregation ATPase